MGLFGLFGGDEKKKKRVPPVYYVRPLPRNDDDDSQNAASPWRQSLGRANQARSTFWNNISGQSWNRAKERKRERTRRRRPHI